MECACHLHDTYGHARRTFRARSAPVWVSSDGIRGSAVVRSTAVTGGNVHRGLRAGCSAWAPPDIRLDLLMELARDAARFFGRDMSGRIWKTGPVPTTVRQDTSPEARHS
jgi:hypothetical protein